MAFFGLFPLLFPSETLAPVESMPPGLRYAARFSPLRYHMGIVLGVFLRGRDLATLWPHAAALAAISVTLSSLALAVLRRQ